MYSRIVFTPLDCVALALLLGLFLDQGQLGRVALAQAFGNGAREYLDQQSPVFCVGVVLETVQVLGDSQHIQLPHHQVAKVLAVPGQLEFDFLLGARGVGLGGQPSLFKALQAAAELRCGVSPVIMVSSEPSSVSSGSSLAFAAFASLTASVIGLLMLVFLPVIGFLYCQYFPFGCRLAGRSRLLTVLARGGAISAHLHHLGQQLTDQARLHTGALTAISNTSSAQPQADQYKRSDPSGGGRPATKPAARI